MIVWVIYGNEIGHGGNGACYFANKSEAEEARKEFNNNLNSRMDAVADAPIKIVIKNKEQLAAALNDAMGYGAS